MAEEHGELKIPRHVAVVMDGNGRWAEERGLDRVEGHREGRHAAKRFVRAANARGVEFVSLYAFSTENWSRPQREVDALMELIETALLAELEELCEGDVRLRVSGRRQELPEPLQRALRQSEEATADNSGMVLNLCVNYGGQVEITDAAKKLAQEVRDGKLDVDDIDPEVFAAHLYVPELPPVDLLIRPGGDLRVSNFLLWQIAYAEFYSMAEYWPAFQPEHLDRAIEDYSRRQRRFGGVVLEE
ncbi:MAG: polyprenyl diphosphate synthase [Armatimonadota bacterium]|nr:polyprenyl diphosphate synthase [Armatimonadota bacterium]